jgi:hypothetical protein
LRGLDFSSGLHGQSDSFGTVAEALALLGSDVVVLVGGDAVFEAGVDKVGGELHGHPLLHVGLVIALV